MKRLIIFTLLLHLIGCGSAPDATPVVVVSETATTRTLEHTFGTTEIPKEPLRIIALGEEGMLADLLDLGVRPVMSIVNEPDAVALISDEEMVGIDVISSSRTKSIETLLEYDPDLIIATVFFADQVGYKRLSDIAPTVTVEWQDTYQQYIDTATVFGLGEQGAQEVAALREQISAEATRLNATERELSVAAIYPGNSVALFFGGPQSAPLLLEELGITFLPTGDIRDDLKISRGRAWISEERWDLIQGDTLIMLQSDAVEDEMASVAEVASNPIWQQLPAVESGNVFVLDRLGYPGLRGQKALLIEVGAMLE